jgi:hypothetical protein
MHTGKAPVAVAEATKDSDLALDTRELADDPLIEQAMRQADFRPDPDSAQPGAWLSPGGIPVDLMVPRALAGPGKKDARSAALPPHAKNAMRRATGLEAAVIDNEEMQVRSLTPGDQRQVLAKVAGPAALLVAKLHKIYERRDSPDRLVDKDAHDLYRILVAIDTRTLAAALQVLNKDDISGDVTRDALLYLQELFAAGPDALGSRMAGRTEEGVGEPETVAQQCAVLANDLLAAVNSR